MPLIETMVPRIISKTLEDQSILEENLDDE